MAAAVSFEIRSTSVTVAARAIAEAQAQLTEGAPALVFCSGRLGIQMRALAERVAELTETGPCVFASGLGVLSERGELDGESAATGIFWHGGKVELNRLPPVDEIGVDDLAQLVTASDGKFCTTPLLVRSEGFDPAVLAELRRQVPNPLIFGAGTYGKPGIVCLNDGEVSLASAAAMSIAGLAPPRVTTAHSFRLLETPKPITKCDGALVLEIDGKPALDVLERLGMGLSGQPLLFTVLAQSNKDGDQMLVRGIQGVDPDRKGLLISNEVGEGVLMSFGVRDPTAARGDMEALCRRLGRELAGAAPRFGLYFNCSGRGQSLHNGQHIDTRIIRERFPSLPLAGFQSAFEIAPYGQGPALQLYTGVLSVFSAPS